MIKNRITIPKEIVDFYDDLANVRKKFIETNLLLEVSDADINTHLEQKVPLINFVGFYLDESKLKEVFEKVAEVIAQHRPQNENQLSTIKKAVLDQEGILAELCQEFLWQRFDKTAKFTQENGLNSELLSLLLFHTVKPFVTSYSLALQKSIDNSNWQEHYCPVCGGTPDLAYEEQDTNKRSLHCSVCDTLWQYKSLKCPHCGNEEHQTLKYFSVDDDEIYRVYVCDKCFGYMKSVNQGKLVKKSDPSEVDLETLHLDILAKKEGYVNNPKETKNESFN